MAVIAIVLGIVIGMLVGFLGIGGGTILVPALTYFLHFDQHTAQGTSLLVQLPPLGLGALIVYWRKKQVDLRAGILCSVGFFVGGYFGSLIAVRLPSRELHGLFGVFLIVSAALLFNRSRPDIKLTDA